MQAHSTSDLPTPLHSWQLYWTVLEAHIDLLKLNGSCFDELLLYERSWLASLQPLLLLSAGCHIHASI